MTRPIGYYVHHQGEGHVRRACLIANALQRPCTLIGTFAPGASLPTDHEILDLPDDRITEGFSGDDGMASRPDAFHYAPIGLPGLRRRMAKIAAWAAAADPALMIVDVSVEVALFAHLLSVPTLVVRLAGARIDQPHLEAFRAARKLLAPFPAVFESPATPDWVRDKTIYAGFLSRPARVRPTRSGLSIMVVLGGGAGVRDAAPICDAARATPSYNWQVFGHVTVSCAVPVNVCFKGWQADVRSELDSADIIVGGAGDGLLADVAVRAKRFICIPEERAFDEQRIKARVLDAHDMAVVADAWPEASQWPALLDRAAALDPLILHALVDPKDLNRTIAAIAAVAAA